MKKRKVRPKPSKSRLRYRRRIFPKALLRALRPAVFGRDILDLIFQVVEFKTNDKVVYPLDLGGEAD